MKLKGKSIIVTGASSGMGRAMAALFVQEGANVIAAARRKERLEALAEELKDAPGRILPLTCDVSKREDNEAMIDCAIKEFGWLDVLVNNAGVMDDMSPVGDVDDDRYRSVMETNLYGPMCAMRKAVQAFKEQGNGGNIINVVSIGAMRTAAGAVYVASKAGLLAMTKNTAYMYIPDGIRCNAIAPGGIQTEISNSMGMPNATGYGRVKNVLAAAPAPWTAEQIASAALFLASDDSSYVNGDVLVVDGGWIAG